MKRINCICLVGLTILVVAVGQIVPMDIGLNKDLVELQRCIDTGDLAQVRQQVGQKGLQGHLNDQYTCKYFPVGGPQYWVFEYMPEFKAHIQSVATQGRVANPVDAPLNSLYHALSRYGEAITAPVANGDIVGNYLAIVRYFLQECQATFNRLPDYGLHQGFLLIATRHGDIEAVKLFTQYGMLQLPSIDSNGQAINILAMLKAKTDQNGNPVSQEMKAIYAQVLPYFERRWFSFTTKNTAIVMVAGAIVALGVKKAYDWFSNSSDEQGEAENAPDAASSTPDQADPVGA